MECDFSESSKFFGIKFIIDENDYDRFVKGYSFTMSTEGYVRYSSRKDGLCGKYIHRMIMSEPPGMVIDHIDGNKLDNRKENLRICTQQQNGWNRGKPSNNTSGFKGVCWHKQTQKWQAIINHKHIGYFKTAEKAYEAYVKAAQELHGDFAKF